MILGIDYGTKNIGLAISAGEIAEPLEAFRTTDGKEAIGRIEKRIKALGIEKIVLGISEGRSKNRTLGFARKLESVLRLPVEYIDETLSTHEASVGKRKDKMQEHAKAAAIILQRYLDSRN